MIEGEPDEPLRATVLQELQKEARRVIKYSRMAARKGKHSRAQMNVSRIAEKYGLSYASNGWLDIQAGRAILNSLCL